MKVKYKTNYMLSLKLFSLTSKSTNNDSRNMSHVSITSKDGTYQVINGHW